MARAIQHRGFCPARGNYGAEGCGLLLRRVEPRVRTGDSYVHTISRARGRTDVPKIVDWYMDGKINIDDLITHVMPLEKINDAFDLMHEGKSIRSVVYFGDMNGKA